MIRISRSVLSSIVDTHARTHTHTHTEGNHSSNKDRANDPITIDNIQVGADGWTSQKRDIVGPRFPRAIVRYRLPMSVVFSRRGPQFPPRARYFLFIGRLIACPSPLPSFTGYGGYPAVGTRRFKLFALCGSPMILAIILNSEESARKGRDVNSDSIAAGYCERGMDASFRFHDPRHEGRRFRRFLRGFAPPRVAVSRFSSRDHCLLPWKAKLFVITASFKKWRRFKESLIYLFLSLSLFLFSLD